MVSLEGRKGLTLINPTLLFALVMLAAPLGMVLMFSFWTQDYLDIDKTPTLKQLPAKLGTPPYLSRG